MKTFRLLLALTLFATSLVAKGQIVCTTDTIDFGTIPETEEAVTARTYVVNIGQAPITLLKVKPTCGCTAVDYQKDVIAPGDSAWIDLAYDPFRRPGNFLKAVRVFPSEGSVLTIPITGTVLASDQTIGMMFPIDIGLLHLSADRFLTPNPLYQDEKPYYPEVYNSGDTPVWIALENDDEAIKTDVFPCPVPPGEKGFIAIYLDPLDEDRKGNLEYTVSVYSSLSPENIKETTPHEIKINASIQK